MLYERITNAYTLKERFVKANRDYFSLEACEIFLELAEEEDTEFDVIGFCCSFNEATPSELLSDYAHLIGTNSYDDNMTDLEVACDLLWEYTSYWELSNGNILYMNF